MSDKKVPFCRLDDYGLVTYLAMKKYEVQVKNGVFEVKIGTNALEKELLLYKSSQHKVFDDTGKHLKKMLKASKNKDSQHLT